MDIRKMRYYQIFSAFFTAILGSLLHFTYQWTGRNPIVASFAAVNESTWEHLKLLFFPMLLTTIIGEFVSYLLILNNFKCDNKIAIILLIVLFLCFIVFTYFTPQIGLFKDPITGKYGILT